MWWAPDWFMHCFLHPTWSSRQDFQEVLRLTGGETDTCRLQLDISREDTCLVRSFCLRSLSGSRSCACSTCWHTRPRSDTPASRRSSSSQDNLGEHKQLKFWRYTQHNFPWWFRVACLTWCGSIVSDVAVHVDGLAVDAELSHAAHKVSVSDWKVLREVGNPA